MGWKAVNSIFMTSLSIQIFFIITNPVSIFRQISFDTETKNDFHLFQDIIGPLSLSAFLII